jgi:MscS family membrane protein
LTRFYINRILALMTILGFAWLLSGIIDLIIMRVSRALKTRHATLSRSVLPLMSRIFKAIILVLAITAVLANWGFDMTAILAGVGIGGIAVALAAQKTIENLFGGVALITDSPVIVGDFCKFGDRVGTVEDIGLRSTRIRTPDRTIVTIPNSEFSSMILENFSRRDKIAFHPKLNLRRDTTADQMHEIIRMIRSTLENHPKVETGVIPVRFVGTGSYSLDVEIYAYILTNNYDEYLRIQEDLLLEIMSALSIAGAGLALPTQASVNYSDERMRMPEPVAS